MVFIKNETQEFLEIINFYQITRASNIEIIC